MTPDRAGLPSPPVPPVPPVPPGAFDHYRQDPSDPATIGLDALMARVAEGRVSPGDATAIVTREVAVARGFGWEAFWALLSMRCAVDAINAGNPWFVRLFVVVILWLSMVRVYRIRRERHSAQE
jgi:hypothetical protein